MTFAEFKRQISLVARERYQGDELSPLQFGIDRARFEEQKLLKLIALAQQAGFATAQRRKAAWERQLIKVRSSRQRFQHIQSDIAAVRPVVQLPVATASSRLIALPRPSKGKRATAPGPMMVER